MPLSETPQWVAVYTNPRAERQVEKRFSEAYFENFLPLHTVKRHWSDRIKVMEVPLIPSYIFVKIRNTDVEKIRRTEGVVLIVSFGQKQHEIAVIPDEEIETLRQFVQSKTELHVYQTSQLVKGARVVIEEGSFAGRQGTIISNCKDGNFAIEIKILNLSFLATLDRNILTPLE